MSVGGRQWIVVAAAFTSMFTIFGVAYSFGAFFDPMAREFGAGHGATAAFFAITAFLWFALGAVTGPLADRIGARPVVAAGAVAMAGGLALTAAVHQLWLGYLTYGLGVGIGTACAYVPMVAAVGRQFLKGRALAIGIAVTGIGMGTVAGPPLSAWLIGRIGWRRTDLVLAAAAAVLLLAVAAATPPAASRAAGGLSLRETLKSRRFQVLFAQGVLVSFGLFFAFAHLTPYAAGRGTPPVQAAALVGFIGVGSATGRILLGAVADRLGTYSSYRATVALLALSFAVWLLAPGYGALVVFALLLGVGYGGWVALSPSLMAELYGAAGMGGSVGTLYVAAGIGGLLGPALGGLAVDATGGYTLPIAISLLLGLVGLGLLFAIAGGRPVHSLELSNQQEVADGR